MTAVNWHGRDQWEIFAEQNSGANPAHHHAPAVRATGPDQVDPTSLCSLLALFLVLRFPRLERGARVVAIAWRQEPDVVTRTFGAVELKRRRSELVAHQAATGMLVASSRRADRAQRAAIGQLAHHQLEPQAGSRWSTVCARCHADRRGARSFSGRPAASIDLASGPDREQRRAACCRWTAPASRLLRVASASSQVRVVDSVMPFVFATNARRGRRRIRRGHHLQNRRRPVTVLRRGVPGSSRA